MHDTPCALIWKSILSHSVCVQPGSEWVLSMHPGILPMATRPRGAIDRGGGGRRSTAQATGLWTRRGQSHPEPQHPGLQTSKDHPTKKQPGCPLPQNKCTQCSLTPTLLLHNSLNRCIKLTGALWAVMCERTLFWCSVWVQSIKTIFRHQWYSILNFSGVFSSHEKN